MRVFELPQHYIFGRYQAKILSIAAPVAAMLDVESLKDIQKHEDSPPGLSPSARDTMYPHRHRQQLRPGDGMDAVQARGRSESVLAYSLETTQIA